MFPVDPRNNPEANSSEDPTQSEFWSKELSEKTASLADQTMNLYWVEFEEITAPFNSSIWSELNDIIEEFHDAEIPIDRTRVLSSLASRNEEFRQMVEDSVELLIIP